MALAAEHGTESGVDGRICETCAFPFGIRDTAGVYRTGSASPQVFEWGSKTTGPEGVTYRGLEGALELNFTFTPAGVPLQQRVTQPGWQRLIVQVSEYTTDINASLFTPPPCFH